MSATTDKDRTLSDLVERLPIHTHLDVPENMFLKQRNTFCLFISWNWVWFEEHFNLPHLIIWTTHPSFHSSRLIRKTEKWVFPLQKLAIISESLLVFINASWCIVWPHIIHCLLICNSHSSRYYLFLPASDICPRMCFFFGFYNRPNCSQYHALLFDSPSCNNL